MTSNFDPEAETTESPENNWGPPVDVQQWDADQAADWFHNSFVSPLKKLSHDLEDILTGKFLDSSIHPWSIPQLHDLQHIFAATSEAAESMEAYWQKYYGAEDA